MTKKLLNFIQISCMGLFFAAAGLLQPLEAQTDETKVTDQASEDKEASSNEPTQDQVSESETGSDEEKAPSNRKVILKPDSPSMAEFKLIQERNIFDPDRRKAREPRRERPPEPPREESFTLLGTMTYGQRILAFFEGTERDWTGSFELGKDVGGHILREVAFDKVVLELEGETIALEVGAGRSRRADEAWKTQDRASWNGGGSRSVRSGRSSSFASRSSRSSDRPGPAADEKSEDSASASIVDGSASDILKQMMERRKQQMGQ
jgi:hypothetical protein